MKPWADYTQNINFLHGRTNKIINHIVKKNFLKRINFALDAAHNLSAVKKEFSFVSGGNLREI